MTELEILAGLKIAYIRLLDILDNQDNQITVNEDKYIRLSMQNLEILYINLYERIEKEKLHYKKDIMIAENIYNDYVTISEDYDDQYITYADLDNEEKWWEDYKFLLK